MAELMSTSSDSSSFIAHTRGRALLGYTVPETDVKLDTVNFTLEKISEILNQASQHSQNQFNCCLRGEIFQEPGPEIKKRIKIVEDKSCNASNISSLVNLYAHGGRTSLPGSSRLGGRYTEHHLGFVKYTLPECENV